MAVLLGSRQSRKIALVLKLSERSDHGLQETILYDGSISTGTRGTGTIFETDIDGQKRLFLRFLAIFDREMRFRGEIFLQNRTPRRTPVR